MPTGVSGALGLPAPPPVIWPLPPFKDRGPALKAQDVQETHQKLHHVLIYILVVCRSKASKICCY